MENDIKKKGKLGQLFCRHKQKGWYVENTLFSSLSGERSFQICKSCGKVLDTSFREYEGMGFK